MNSSSKPNQIRLSIDSLEGRLALSLTPVTPELTVTQTLTSNRSSQAIDSDNSGNYVVTWASDNQDGNGLGVYAQRYNAAGIA